MKTFWIGMMAITFVLGTGMVAVMYILGKMTFSYINPAH
jgi:glycerol uptake facilitator-like aquaporin